MGVVVLVFVLVFLLVAVALAVVVVMMMVVLVTLGVAGATAIVGAAARRAEQRQVRLASHACARGRGGDDLPAITAAMVSRDGGSSWRSGRS